MGIEADWSWEVGAMTTSGSVRLHSFNNLDGIDPFKQSITPWKLKMEPKNECLEDDCPFELSDI